VTELNNFASSNDATSTETIGDSLKEVALVLSRALFSKLLNERPKEMEIVCKGADKFVSCEDAILLHWLKIEWNSWNDDYIHIMTIISALDLEEECQFHFLEWNDDFHHKDEMGSYYLNPWKTDLETGISNASNEKAINLEAFF
jgi:hypothetical protein